MAINYYTENTKLDKISTRLFDIKSKSTSYGKDIDLNSLGALDRIVGLDKLQQQTEKSLLLKKGSYSNNKLLGTDLLDGTRKDTVFINKDVKDSLSTYASIQQGQKTSSLVNILGRNVYRTVDIDDINAWIKLNDYVIPINEFSDTDININTTYYYSTTTVYRDTSNRIKESQITMYQSVIVSSEDTMNALIDSNFILVAGSQQVTLYWNLSVEMAMEEQLRSILSVRTTPLPGDPRGVQVSVRVTNRELTESQIETIGA